MTTTVKIEVPEHVEQVKVMAQELKGMGVPDDNDYTAGPVWVSLAGYDIILNAGDIHVTHIWDGHRIIIEEVNKGQ